MEPPSTDGNRTEAERLLGVAEKLLVNKDLAGSREFALLAQDNDPLLERTDQILAICDVLIASEKCPSAGPAHHNVNKRHEWYSILQLDDANRSDPALIKRNYRRLALLLHPDKNKFPLADSAFRLVADAWAVLSDPHKKSAFDFEVRFSPVELTPTNPNPNNSNPNPPPQSQPQQTPISQNKLPVRRTTRQTAGGQGGGDSSPKPPPPLKTNANANRGAAGGGSSRFSNFWTACPYCYVLYEYPRVYEDCCLRCQSCNRAFHAAAVASLPPRVPGKEAYYCCWGFFPLGFSLSGSESGKKAAAGTSAFPNWMPPMFGGEGVGMGMGMAGAGPRADSSARPRNSVAEEEVTARRETVAGVSTGNETVGVGVRMELRSRAVTGSDCMKKKRGRPRKNPL